MSNPATLKLLTLLNVSAIHPQNKRRESAALSAAEAKKAVPKKRKTVVWPDELESGPSGSGSTHSTPSAKKTKTVSIGGAASADQTASPAPKTGAGGKKAAKAAAAAAAAAEAEVDSDEEGAAGGQYTSLLLYQSL